MGPPLLCAQTPDTSEGKDGAFQFGFELSVTHLKRLPE